MKLVQTNFCDAVLISSIEGAERTGKRYEYSGCNDWRRIYRERNFVGIAAWQLAAAAVSGFIAKENVVGTLAVCYGLSAFIDTQELALVGNGNVVASAMAITKVAALAYLMFNLYTPPCFAAIGAMNSEMQSKKWLWGGIALQLGTGYTVAFLVYQFGTLITTGKPGNGFVAGLIAVLIMVSVIVGVIYKNNKQFATEYELNRAA